MHYRSKLFSLIGREVVLNDPYHRYDQVFTHAVIKGKLPHRMRFGLQFPGFHSLAWFDRSEFRLPPLPPQQRQPDWVLDEYDGFVYAGIVGF